MSIITLAVAQTHLQEALDAESKAMRSKRYDNNGAQIEVSIHRQELKDIRAEIEYWSGKEAELIDGVGPGVLQTQLAPLYDR